MQEMRSGMQEHVINVKRYNFILVAFYLQLSISVDLMVGKNWFQFLIELTPQLSTLEWTVTIP